ncbi:receptor-transporting protein 4-like isoform X3 [Daphnia pulex]|uniref:receptor-transporting protein 4-like isoform X3 n=1 Tax=Daphnia pulex TaxID=6669 RepID=UPI001EE0C905|nr:receptor-transporting protein 4-like isoform X3 [Daphnia pulex]
MTSNFVTYQWSHWLPVSPVVIPCNPVVCVVANFPQQSQFNNVIRPKFRNSNEYVQLLLDNFKSELGIYYIPASTFSGDPYGGLERFWKNSFLWLFIELYENNHLWTLKPVEKPPIEDGKGTPWETVIHSAKVRFNCEMANHGWTSMQGRVVFWFRILYGIESGFVRGEVVFKLYGQKCERCTSGAFETALWYPEEIANAMWNLYSKVAEKFYGRPVDKVVRGLRGGKPRTPHKPELCQSCSDGLPCGKP